MRRFLDEQRIRTRRTPAARLRRQRVELERLEERTLLSLNFNFVQSVSGILNEMADVASDSSGNVYVSGSFEGTVDFDPDHSHAGNPDVVTSSAGRDAFVAKYSSTGAFLWVKTAGGAEDDRVNGLVTDGSGNVYATGFYTGTATFGNGLSLNNPSGLGVFVWKLDTNGTPVWVVGPTGSPGVQDQGVSIVLDSGGNLDVAGWFQSTMTFATTGGSVAMTAGGVTDPFIAKLTTGGSFLWAKQLKMQTSTDTAVGLGITSDGSSNVYATGYFRGTIDLNPGAGTDLHTSAGLNQSPPTHDAFVVKLDSSGSFVWGRTYGSTDQDEGDAITFDGTSNVYVTGGFSLTVDFDPGVTHPNGVDILTAPSGGFGMYVLKLDTAGNFVWVKNLNVSNPNLAVGRPGVVVDGSGNVYAGGDFAGTADLGPITLGAAGTDPYIIRLDSTGNILDGTRGGGAGDDSLWGLAITPTGSPVFGANVSVPSSFGGFTVPSRGLPTTIAFGTVSNVTMALPPTQGDFDGDHKADLVVYRPPTAQWFALQSKAGPAFTQFGQALGDIPIAADFDGDGQTDIAVFRPSTATWYILQSTAGPRIQQFGSPGDIPLPYDFDGDHKADFAVFRPSTATWYIRLSSGGARVVQFGGVGLDQPVPADYDGDGKTDLAVFRPSTAQWFILQSTAGPRVQSFGAPNLDQPVPADYDGDGKADLAVLRPTTYDWFILQSTSGPRHQQFGSPTLGDIPMPEDFDGDGRADLALFRSTTATWYILQTTAGPRIQQFGAASEDYPEVSPLEFRYKGDTSIRTASFSPLSGNRSPGGGTLTRTAVLVPLVPQDATSALAASSTATSKPRTKNANLIDLALASAVDELGPGPNGTLR